jgi:ABC-type nitrate/sulfonate/bicarbonate transport system permease component
MIAVVLAIGIIGYALNEVVRLAERHVLRHRSELL